MEKKENEKETINRKRGEKQLVMKTKIKQD
jgi:hypothetical protein